MTNRHIVVLTLDIDPEIHSDPVDWDWTTLLDFAREGVLTSAPTKDGLVLHSWSPPGVKVPLPDDQWVDPDPARDHPGKNFEELLKNSDQT